MSETLNRAPSEAVYDDWQVQAYKALGEKGVVFLGEPRAVTPTDWAVHFKDVDGHLLSLFGPEGKA